MYETIFPPKVRKQGLRFLDLMAKLCLGGMYRPKLGVSV